MLERHHIEGNPAGAIAANLQAAYDEYCSTKYLLTNRIPLFWRNFFIKNQPLVFS